MLISGHEIENLNDSALKSNPMDLWTILEKRNKQLEICAKYDDYCLILVREIKSINKMFKFSIFFEKKIIIQHKNLPYSWREKCQK